MSVSIVIPVHGKAALTVRCLDALQQELGGRGDVEVIVVDDASPDDTLERIGTSAVRLIRHEASKGFAASCNDGAAEATGDYIVFLNNDIVPRNGWLDCLIAYSNDRPGVGVVGAKLLYPNETIQHAGMVICSDLLPRHVYRGFPADHPAVARSRRFQAVTGACLLVQRDLFTRLGGFDQTFRNGFEDVDFCLRLGAAGHDVHYCADSVLVHLEAATRGEDAATFRQNAGHYLERWAETVRPDDLVTYAADGLLRLEPSDVYPLRLEVSPMLAVAEADEMDTFKLLALRSRQVFDLLKESTTQRTADAPRRN